MVYDERARSAIDTVVLSELLFAEPIALHSSDALRVGLYSFLVTFQGSTSRVVAATLPLLSSDFSKEPAIHAFDYFAKVGDVHIAVKIGFFRPLVLDKEIDDETDAPTSREKAGISVICNDRVVLLHDRTIKTF